MLVLFLNKLNEQWLLRINQMKERYKDVRFESYFSSDSPRKLLEQADVVVSARLSRDEIFSARNLKLIIVPMAGVNGLDLEAIRSRGTIKIANCHTNAFAVAERALALALALLGRVVEYDNDLRKGIWHGYSVGSPKEDLWFSLRGKTVCIVGMGSIGKELEKLLAPFNCRIIGVKKSAPCEPLSITSNLDWAIEQADIVFVTVPLTRETKGLFNEERLRKMAGKYLINVSRGEVIEEEALYKSLKNGILAGAAIDTWYNYPSSRDQTVFPSKYDFQSLRNVVLSPHVGGYCEEALRDLMNETFTILERFLQTQEVINEVDPWKEY